MKYESSGVEISCMVWVGEMEGDCSSDRFASTVVADLCCYIENDSQEVGGFGGGRYGAYISGVYSFYYWLNEECRLPKLKQQHR